MAKVAKVFETPFETYTAVRQIGSGGSGVVFMVKTSEGQDFALKMLDRSRTPRQKVRRFQNEIQFCQRQASDRIVRVLDYGQAQDGSVFYVMPYYGSTLRDLIKKQLPVGERLPLFVQVLDSVEAAHLLGVCHRDIKPENVLYDSATKQIVLADFGIARFTEDELLTIVETGPTERLANFAYAAPEQRIAGKAVNQSADIYALGLILNEMFTGEIPQGAGFRKIKETAPDLAYLDELVDMMVQQRPEERIQPVARVKQELIGRGNNFASLQRLDLLKKQVVPESEISDRIIADPIRVVDKVDWNVIESMLTLRLNQPINAKWEQCFRERATSYSTTFSHGNIRFSGDRVFIHVDEYHLPHGIQYLQQYIPAANEEYATRVKQEHRQQIAQRRTELERRVREQEARIKVLQKVQI
jgi:eukaryotic-like serine/threonine-protein kinase